LPRAKIVRQPAVKADLIAIWNYVAAESPRAADGLLGKIDQQIVRLADFPEIGSHRPEISFDTRVLVSGKYLILYRLKGETVEIVRVVHGARDLTELF
jgi:toxin ParE1/3/4